MPKEIVTEQDVEKAILRFEAGERQSGRGAVRSTYVLSKSGIAYPAKHIWGLASEKQYFQTQEAEAGFIKLGYKVVGEQPNIISNAIGASTISLIAKNLNSFSGSYKVGRLQDIRKSLKGLRRRASKYIFHDRTVFSGDEHEYCFHDGGRTELQFNVGFEDYLDENVVRYGVGFSLEPGQSLPTIDPLLPRISRFNDYIETHPDLFSDMRMWVWNEDGRSPNHFVNPIPIAWVNSGAFIFLGKIGNPEEVTYETILEDFDRLLSLYKYVETPINTVATNNEFQKPFKFKPGFSKRKSNSKLSHKERKLDVRLRHNDLQYSLCVELANKYGKQNIAEEVPNGAGGFIDVVRRISSNFVFYEIKTSDSPRSCIREAIGQLLEYSYWPNTVEPKEIIVVGPSALDSVGIEYLNKLRGSFNLPIKYKHVELIEGISYL